MARARLAALFFAAALVLGVGGTPAFADGDPASDVLLGTNVFLPYPPPSRTASDPLAAQVAAVYAKGERVKVALIATRVDLGAVPGLFGKPAQYAAFLGQELSSFYAGPLLVVMRTGFGIYDAGRSTAAEERVLAHEQVHGASADDLARAATTAVGRLLAARALVSKDIRPPIAWPDGAARHGSGVRLRYLLLDDSGRASAVLSVVDGRKRVVARFAIPLGPADTFKPRSVDWPLPHGLPRGKLTFCVSAADPAGNASKPACGPLQVLAP
jgi:hypothetical protein